MKILGFRENCFGTIETETTNVLLILIAGLRRVFLLSEIE